MKHIRIILTMTMVVLLGQSAQAILFRNTQMAGYSTGNLGNDAGTGTLEGWQNATAQVTVTNGSGSLIGTNLGLVASAGDRAFASPTNTLNVRNLFVPANGTFPQNVETNVYYSFLYKFKNAAEVTTDGEVFVRLNRANSGTGTPQHFDLLARNVAGQIQIGISKAGAPNNVTNFAATNISIGQTIFIVVKQHIIPAAQNDVYDLWINPPSQYFGTNDVDVPPSDASVGALTTDGTEDASNTGPGRFVFASGVDSEFDEFRVATTWAEVTPAFGSCVGAGFEQHPASVTQVAELAATFTVKPLSSSTSPTIQWQRSTNGGTTFFNISGATASSYTTPNLALAESGSQYRAIVNVACNSSSATSTVASVTLSAPTATAIGIVMNDTFLDPDLAFDDRANLPLTSTNSTWYTSVTDDLTCFSQGGNMLAIPAAGASRLWLGYFTATNDLPVHLAVGRTLKVTLPFTPTGFNSFTNNAGLRFGLFDYFDGGTRIQADSTAAGGSTGNGNGVRGYMLNLDWGTNFSVNSPIQLLGRNFLSDINLIGTVSDYESYGSGPAGGGYTGASAFQAGTQYTLEFSVARTDVNTCVVTAKITGGSLNMTHSVIETNLAYHRFDSFAIRPNSLETSADSFSFSEFKVEVLQGAVSVAPFSITSVQQVSPTAINLTWPTVVGATYHVLTRSTITGADTTNTTIVATGTTTSTNLSITGTERYYRVLAPPYTP